MKEALSQKEPVGQIARRHQVSEALIYRWRKKFFEGGKAALAFEGHSGSGGEKAEAVKSYRQFYNYERLHIVSLGYRTPAAVYLTRDGQKL